MLPAACRARTVPVLIASILLAAIGAQFESGETLYRKCTGQDLELRHTCQGYITAVADSMVMYESMGAEALVCLPAGTTKGNVTDTVVAYLQKNPSKRRLAASGLAILALKEAYPCDDGDPD